MMDVPGVRKEAATVAQRAATTAARWLDDVGIDDPSLAADALALIRAALHGHPAALRPRVDALERTLVETMCLAVDPDVVAAAVECVVATPRAGAVAGASAGEGAVADAATAWSSLARRIAIAAHDVLDVALRGAEPTDASSSARGVTPARRDQNSAAFRRRREPRRRARRRRARGVSRDASVGVSRRASPRVFSERRRPRPRGCGVGARDARGESRRRRRRGGARITFGGDSRRDARGVPRVTRRRRESHDGARAMRRRDDRTTRGCGRAPRRIERTRGRGN